jgi:C4-dicarboxylate-specific signal transduction histidine kinase
VLEPAAEGFYLGVLDDGPGFNPLPTATSASPPSATIPRAPRDEGLGLAIVHEIVRRAGWTLARANRAEGGLEVVIRGPRA